MGSEWDVIINGYTMKGKIDVWINLQRENVISRIDGNMTW